MSITFHVKFCNITVFFFQNKEMHLGRISTLSIDTIKAMTSCEVWPRLHPTGMHPMHSSQNVNTTIWKIFLTLKVYLERFSFLGIALRIGGKFSCLNWDKLLWSLILVIFYSTIETPVQGLEPIFDCHVVWYVFFFLLIFWYSKS